MNNTWYLTNQYSLKYETRIPNKRRILGISTSNLSNCLTGRSKTAGGFKWKYKNNIK